jgi:hypothetical protein
MNIERAIGRLPSWEVAELIDRIEDRRIERKPETKEGIKGTTGFNLGIPGLGGVSASLANFPVSSIGAFFKEHFTGKGRELEAFGRLNVARGGGASATACVLDVKGPVWIEQYTRDYNASEPEVRGIALVERLAGAGRSARGEGEQLSIPEQNTRKWKVLDRQSGVVRSHEGISAEYSTSGADTPEIDDEDVRLMRI